MKDDENVWELMAQGALQSSSDDVKQLKKRIKENPSDSGYFRVDAVAIRF